MSISLHDYTHMYPISNRFGHSDKSNLSIIPGSESHETQSEESRRKWQKTGLLNSAKPGRFTGLEGPLHSSEDAPCSSSGATSRHAIGANTSPPFSTTNVKDRAPKDSHSISVGEPQWKIGVGSQHVRGNEIQSEGQGCEGEEARSFLRKRENGLLYPLLDSLRQRCHMWSTSCVGRVKKVLNQSTTGRKLTLPTSTRKSSRYRWGPGDEAVSSEHEGNINKLRVSPRRNSKAMKSPPNEPHEMACLSRIPQEVKSCKKLIFFIRHGTAFCNVAKYGGWRVDQRLTTLGWKQVSSLRAHLQKITKPQVVI